MNKAYLEMSTAVGQAAFKISIALFDQGALTFEAGASVSPKVLNVVHLRAKAVADADHLVHQISNWHVYHACWALTDHFDIVRR